MRRRKPEALGTSHRLCSLFDAELCEDVLDVRFHGLGSDDEVACDFLIGKALGNKIENGDFTCRDGERRRRLARSAWFADAIQEPGARV
jgi:hypothetical protein